MRELTLLVFPNISKKIYPYRRVTIPYYLVASLWIITFFFLSQTNVCAEGTPSLAPSDADAVSIYVGAGNTGSLGGDYGQFAWVGSASKLHFNIQQLNEKVYLGFSLPWNNREFSTLNPYTNEPGISNDLLFRIVAPDGTPLTCFGRNGWQALDTSTVNISTRMETVVGPQSVGGTGGYVPFVFDPSTCEGLSQVGDYYVEFRSRDPNYDPNTNFSGFYIEYFDITVVDVNDQAIDGRIWSNNWCIGIKADGDGHFDRAFNGAFYVCSAEGFVTKINFNTGINTREEEGKNNDQRSGFRAGTFNVSFNTTGPNNTGDIITDRQSVMNENATNPQLRVFLNPPSEELCEPEEVGEFAPAATVLSGCPNDRCINMTATQAGQVEVLIEKAGGNGVFDAPSDRILAFAVTPEDLAEQPQTTDFIYEFCIPWDGKDGEGNFLVEGGFTIAGSYSQGVYHFPVYDAEFNDDGFTIETINPPDGFQKTFYDDTHILESSNIPTEQKDGSNGCLGACHRWTGEWEHYVFGETDQSNEIYGNFNTINTWWFAITQIADVTGSLNNQSLVDISCPPDISVCPNVADNPIETGQATSLNTTDACTASITYTDEVIENLNCSTSFVRTWNAFIEGIPDTATCNQTIFITDRQRPQWEPAPEVITVSCLSVPDRVPPTVTDNCRGVTVELIEEKREEGICPIAYRIVRRWRATDDCGNTNTRREVVRVRDNRGPRLLSEADDLIIACTASDPLTEFQTWLANNGGATAFDNCSELVWSYDYPKLQLIGESSFQTIFIATDNCGNTIETTASVLVKDTSPPTWTSLPNSLDRTYPCGAIIPNPLVPQATDNCSNTAVFAYSDEKTQAACAGYVRVITYLAMDNEGNESAPFTVTLTTVDNDAPILVGVPSDERLACSEILPPIPLVTAKDYCDEAVHISFEETIEETSCNNNYTLLRTWTGTDVCGNTTTESQTIWVEDMTPPTINCPTDIFIQKAGSCGATDRTDIELPTAVDNCDGNILVSSSIDLEMDFPVGTTVVTATAIDNCDNKSTCQFNVIVSAGESNVETSECPSDITVSCNDMAGQTTITWEPPSGDACCSICTDPIEKEDFIYLGDRGGHRYYLSKTPTTWEEATLAANNLQGYLAVINDPAENDFLTNFLTSSSVYIGLSDEGKEGDFYWINGDTLIYSNWHPSQPNNKNNSQHFGQLLPDGTWNDTYQTDLLAYIVEIPCVKVIQTSGPLNGSSFSAEQSSRVTYQIEDDCGNIETCTFNVMVESALTVHVPNDVNFSCQEGIGGTTVDWPKPYAISCCDDCSALGDSISGFEYIGRYNGHQYYCSFEKTTWQQASTLAQELGGYLVSINDPSENRLIADFLTDQSVHIGLSDRASEGRFVWTNGERLTFQNWHTDQPNNLGGEQDFVMMTDNGFWDDIFDYQELKFIMELPCLEVRRIDDGPANGSIFPTGTTTVIYEASDNCGNTIQESFDINIGACSQSRPNFCSATGGETNSFWINEVQLGDTRNYSGNDGGYGDYTSQAIGIEKGTTQVMTLSPGFAATSFDLYWRVFIDYNQDGDFDDSGEIVFSYQHSNPLRINFSVPATSKTGNTTMRVAMKQGGFPSSCEAFTSGEVEDYTITIIESELRGATTTSRSADLVEIVPLPMEQWLPIGSPLEVSTSIPSIQAYPNPTKNELTISIQQLIADNAAMVIFNSLGQLVHQQQLKANANQQIILNVEQYKTGIYFISIGGDGQTPILQKFTKL